MSNVKNWAAELGMPEEPETQPEQEYINEASYQANNVIELAKTQLNMLAGLCLPTVFRFLFPPVHLAIWDLMLRYADTIVNFPQLALGIPRGHGKTTIIKLFLVYCILFTKRKFILVIAANATKAEAIIADVCDMLDESNIVRLFGSWRVGMEKDTQAIKKFGFRGRTVILAALGAGGSVRGLNLKNERPDVMIFDDIQDAECAESQLMSATLEKWFIGTAMKAKSPHGCLFIFAGNFFPTEHSLLKKLKKNPTWIKFISGAILADGTALWPELRSMESLYQELENDINLGHPEIFFSEVQNDTEVGINTKVDYSLFAEWRWGEHEIPQGQFVLIDPSGNKQGSDLVAIGHVVIYDEVPGLRSVIEEQLSPGNTIRKALLMALQTGTKVIVCESVGYQSTLLYWFNQIAENLNLTGFHFLEVYPGSVSKNARIIDGIKGLQAKEIVLHPDTRSKVQSQISNFNPLKRNNVDNILDLITYITKVIESYGPLLATDMNLELQEANSAKVVEQQWSF